jgi:hypothetical protein
MKIWPTCGLLISRADVSRAFLIDPLTVVLFGSTPIAIAAFSLLVGLGYLSAVMALIWILALSVVAIIVDWHIFVSVTITPTNVLIREYRIGSVERHKKTIDGRFMLLAVADDILRPDHKIIFRNYVPYIAEFSFWCYRPKAICDWLNEERLRLTGQRRLPHAIARTAREGFR